jgi:hypothetical protein
MPQRPKSIQRDEKARTLWLQGIFDGGQAIGSGAKALRQSACMRRQRNHSHQAGNTMAKGQKRSNREFKKPKALKSGEPVPVPSATDQKKAKAISNISGNKK